MPNNFLLDDLSSDLCKIRFTQTLLTANTECDVMGNGHYVNIVSWFCLFLHVQRSTCIDRLIICVETV